MSLAGRGCAALNLNPSPSSRGRITLSAPSRSRSRRRALSRAALVIAATTAGIVLSAIPALAHITVTPGSAPPGSAAVLTFHIPNEEASAYTTRVDMQIPTDHPIAQLLVKPVAGWTIGVRTITLAKPLVTDDGQFTQAVSEVIWSGGRIAPGQFQDFSLSADPLPQGVSQLTFKTIQTYSNGNVVRWIDVAAPGQPEPDHPAPLLTLTAGAAAAGGTAGAGSTAGIAAASSGTASGSASTAPGSDGTARAIAAGGVLIGLLGLALAGLCWQRFKATAVRELPALTRGGNGFVPASAVHHGQEQGNGTDRSQSARPGPESGPPGAARGAPRRKGASGRRGSSNR
jgi:periplasmic copper chaperone A